VLADERIGSVSAHTTGGTALDAATADGLLLPGDYHLAALVQGVGVSRPSRGYGTVETGSANFNVMLKLTSIAAVPKPAEPVARGSAYIADRCCSSQGAELTIA
jgi:hypothetical protein